MPQIDKHLKYLKKIKDLEFLKKFKSDSTLTEEDALKLGEKLNKNLVKRYKKIKLFKAISSQPSL